MRGATRWIAIVVLGLSVIAIVLWSILSNGNDEKETMSQVKNDASIDRVVPPIDLYAPKKIETATFALG